MQPVFPAWSYAKFFAGPIPQSAELPGDLPTYLEPSFAYRTLDLVGSTNLLGFFQSERYFSQIANEIRQVLAPIESIRSQCQTQLASLRSFHTCSIHVRRGDYVQKPWFADLPATDYYERAMNCFPPETRFLMFSDDLAFCRQRFHDQRILFVNGGSEVIDLCTMTLCNSHIIANSSFSWWGAWLNPNTVKKVIAPQRWFAGPAADPNNAFVSGLVPGQRRSGFRDTRDLIPNAWIRI